MLKASSNRGAESHVTVTRTPQQPSDWWKVACPWEDVGGSPHARQARQRDSREGKSTLLWPRSLHPGCPQGSNVLPLGLLDSLVGMNVGLQQTRLILSTATPSEKM